MKYSLHPEAQQDLRDAAAFYQDRAGSNLSQSLLVEFEHSVNLLLRHPQLGALWIVYTVRGDEIHILAVAHQSRRPGFWRGRK